MTQVLRMFQTAVDPADLDEVRRFFSDDVLPVFRDLPGCLGIELLLCADHHPGGLVESAAISRWQDRESMEEAVGSRPAKEAQVRIFELLRQEPVVRIFDVVAHS